MNELNYEQVYESCKKELTQQLDLSKNKDHFLACFRNICEEDIISMFDLYKENKNNHLLDALTILLNSESESRINRIAAQHAHALMEELS